MDAGTPSGIFKFLNADTRFNQRIDKFDSREEIFLAG